MILLPMRFQCKHSLFLISASTVTIEKMLEEGSQLNFWKLMALFISCVWTHWSLELHLCTEMGRTFRVYKEEQNKVMVFMKLLRDTVLYFGANIIVDTTGSCLGMVMENRGWPGIHAFTIKEQTPFTLVLFCCGGNTWRSNKCKKFLTQDQYMKKMWKAYGGLIS